MKNPSMGERLFLDRQSHFVAQSGLEFTSQPRLGSNYGRWRIQDGRGRLLQACSQDRVLRGQETVSLFTANSRSCAELGPALGVGE